MVQCEMCGAETASPKTVKVEGAELDVCENCTDFGTEVRDQSTSSASTKYSTSSDDSGGGSESGSATTRSSGSTSRSSGGGSRSDMFDDVEELATDYDDRIRAAREQAGLSQEDLAAELNEKASLISKLEQGKMLPSDDVQSKIERKLDISLTESAGEMDADWESDSEAGSYTLGDVVDRKD